MGAKRCVHLHGTHPSSPRAGQSSWGTLHPPSAIPNSEFGDPELGPLYNRDMLRKATVFRLFDSLENQGSTQVLSKQLVLAIASRRSFDDS
jgi:hypothetical protein